jgi:phosphoglycerate dehydrogenase-like enzyme|tara:strand:- start:2929 stop:3894 length:966 start_codon:yes stop_codon:yes gene_type:complete
MTNLKVVIGTDHVGTHYADELIDSFPDIDFIVAYEPSDHVEAVKGADAFFGWPNGEAFDAADQLKWIACPGMGIDKIVAYQNIVESEVPITNAPGTHVTSMGDHVIGVMVGLTHRFQEAFEDRQKKTWDTEKYAARITEITGTTVGIFGLGAIGRAVAERVSAFGTTTYAIDPAPLNVPATIKECWDLERLDDLAKVSDFLVIAAPVLDTTRNSIDARRIAMMPKGSYIIVISRGEIVDEDAMCDALESGHLAGVALDATAVEPLADDSRLWTLPNVILTPHSSALTPELYEMRRQAFKSNLRRFAAGEKLENICNKTVGF